jgi:P4 family phage/plasmid primase-like protien
MIKRENIWSVFPVQANDKKPYPFLRNDDNQRGFYVATTNEEQIASWERMYSGSNWALRTGTASGCWVLDIDVKNGARGEDSFFALLGAHKDFPDTLAVKTPSGGMHYYFEMEPGVRTIINGGKFGGIDVRADGGYVLIPPSKIDGNSYEYINENKILKAPTWLKEELFPYKEQKEGANVVERIPQGDFRSESLAKFLLNKYVPKAVKGMRNQVLMDMLCQMRDNIIPSNIAEDMALEYVKLMNDPGFTTREALATCRSVYRRSAREANYVDLDVTFNVKEVMPLKNYDQAGIADYILNIHRNLAYIPERSWVVYKDDGYWHAENADAMVSDLVVEELRTLANNEACKGSNSLFKVNKKNVDDIMSFMKKKVWKPLDAFNSQPNLINCKNGVIDLRTLELYKHNAGFFFDYVLDVNYNPNADMTRWNKFLRESLENADRKEDCGIYQLELLQLSAGYSITGETNEECLFYIYGKTRSGKSTFINTINEILGPLASTIQMSALLQKKFVSDSQNFELASLINKRFVVSSETDRETYLDSAKIKNLTGRDTIKCAFKYKDPFQAKVKFKMWLTSNNEITVDATDDAVWGRFRTFSFPYSKMDNVDINLKDNLLKDKDGIFFWLCLGAHVWYSMKERGQRLPMPASMKSYLDTRKMELDSFGEFLIYRGYYPVEKGTKDDAVCFISNNDMYNKYCAWCDVNQISNRYSKFSMTQILTQKGFEKDSQRVAGANSRGVWVRIVNLNDVL